LAITLQVRGGDNGFGFLAGILNSAPTFPFISHQTKTQSERLRMTGERRERLKELCEIVQIDEVEGDPELLSDLAYEICEIILAEANHPTKRNDRAI
jgi:hypothetical protein